MIIISILAIWKESNKTQNMSARKKHEEKHIFFCFKCFETRYYGNPA